MLGYYLYRHLTADSEIPFYIGIGTIYDKDNHYQMYQRSYSVCRSNYWKNVYKKHGRLVQIMNEYNTLAEVIEAEKFFINLYGYRSNGGLLVNQTSGGDININYSDEYKKRISKWMLGNKNGIHQIWDDNRKKKLSELKKEYFKNNTSWNKGKKMPKWVCEKISNGNKGKKLSESHKLNLLNKTGTPKSIMCIETSVIFPSISECARSMFGKGRCGKNSLINVLKNKKDTYKGYTFKYVENGM